MRNERIEQLLETCGNTWMGGQRKKVRAAMCQLVNETTQSQKQSMVEALTGTAVGFCISMAWQVWIMYYYDLPSTLVQDVLITVSFTGISILRGYAVRRFFNWRHRAKHIG